jgi:hypothetical protein
MGYRRVTRTHAGMGMGINLYPLADMGNPTGLFFCRGYGYGIMIPGGYLPIAISRCARPEVPSVDPFALLLNSTLGLFIG